MPTEQSGSTSRDIIRIKYSNGICNPLPKEKEIIVAVLHQRDKKCFEMQTAGIILSLIIVAFRLKHWKKNPEELGWILAEILFWMIVLSVLLFASCKISHSLQKEPNYEHYQKNESWKD